ncbi:MAG: FkbM family methyltransferase [Bryobacteraceae bacterium]
MISYAQNFEDVMLHRVFEGRKDGFYIDVGACDPVVESVTKFFYDEGWSGINLEPNEWFYSKLLADRPRDINLNLAVGEREECRPFYVFEQIGNSTFEEASRDRYVEKGFGAEQKTVHVTTLAAVCRDYVRRPIDFLKVDCEGWEKFVLRGADWDRFRPIVVIVEATEPGTTTPAWPDWEPYLIETARYEKVYFDGLNRFYVRREYADLRCRFEAPPNVFDDFKLHTLQAAEESNHALVQVRDSLTARVAELEEKLHRTAAETEEKLNRTTAEMEEKLRRTAAEMEEKLNRTAAEDLRLTELLRAQEVELRCAQASRDAAEQARRALIQDRDNLAGRLAEMEAQAMRDQEQIAELEKERRELEAALVKSRLWVGQLSQNLAACKQRPRG